MARRQTHGLGRMGRIWSDGLGNLMATRYHVMSIELEKISQLSFVTALAAYDALSDIEGVANDLTIKWPNDLLHSGRKLCGILINSESQGEGEVGIAIGIGVNIASAPELATYDTACLASILSYVPKPEDLLRSIDAALEKRLNLLENKGFDPIASDWLSHAYGRDHPITVQTEC